MVDGPMIVSSTARLNRAFQIIGSASPAVIEPARYTAMCEVY